MPDQRHYDVLILGGGFAGVYCAQRLVKRLKKSGKNVGLIASENHMVFQPMLAEVVGGSLAPRHVVNPIRHLCEGADVFRGTIQTIDCDKKQVVIDGGLAAGLVSFTYDHLVLTLGADVDLSRIPGMVEHAYLMRNAGDAMKLRASIIARMEEANLINDPAIRKQVLSFIIVGGGYSGVETAGQIRDLLNVMASHYEQVKLEDTSVTLIHSGDRLLPTLSAQLGDYTGKMLTKMGVTIRYNSRVKSVTSRSVILGCGTKLEATSVVCTVGNAPNPQILKLAEKKSLPIERGRIVVEPTGQVKGCTHLWSAGDCAIFPKAGGGDCPQTAQFAYRQGQTLGDNLIATFENKPLKPFTFQGLGELASIGHRMAVAEIFGMRFSGLIAWFMWRTIYLMKLPGLDRKLRVMSEWTFDLFFARDINLLTPQYTSPLEEMHLEPGDILFNPGEPAFSFYAVKSGHVDITDASGHIVKSARTGDHFGERALLEDHIWRFQATAIEPTTLVAIGDRTFQKLVGSIGSLQTLFNRTAETYDSPQEIEQVLAMLPQQARNSKVSEMMSTNLSFINQNAPIHDALHLFQTERHSTYPVVDNDQRVIGLLRRGDGYEWFKHHVATPQSTVRELPLKTPLMIAPDMPLPEVFASMVRKGVNKAVIADENQKLLGMLSLSDLFSAPQAPVPTAPASNELIPAM
ncbi:CBS domain-containing protein [Phragmitibacter flavus]|uniref:NADH:ubiquinone reductase (non-electrogenic) n=1 Tax=Phragmitibacter flavus TaxID=2576071 RepID=A0A5R8K747_9BACT|nr:FAD-dependent oxidoreductase [Phragmitibacter flavus]TLD68191.1 CBS domain-containing protein [Phragmitibacter flavus]